MRVGAEVVLLGGVKVKRVGVPFRGTQHCFRVERTWEGVISILKFRWSRPMISFVMSWTDGWILHWGSWAFFARWAPAKLAAWVLCKPLRYMSCVDHFQPFIEENG
eukprot:1143588-Pelagomonas_calceolata.AAC.2